MMMYFGSVRFFKHIILIAMALIVVFSISSCVYMMVSNQNMKRLLKENGIQASDSARQNSSIAVRADLKLTQKEQMSQYYLSSFAYQLSYPQLYIDNDFVYKADNPKSVYLTFDDGLSSLTPQILDILKEHDIHATFFIIYNDSSEAQALYKRILAEGHTIGVHSTCHKYDTIYQSTEAYLEDFAQTAMLLEQVTGIKPEIFRFPGGSINTYNSANYMPIIAEMARRGYTYYDWNVSANDAKSTTSQEQIHNNVVTGVQKHSKSIVLMHDSADKVDTVSALPAIIEDLKAEGYTFYALDKDVYPVSFSYIN